MRLADRIALVTGAAKGMGWDICTTFAREGADLVLAARDVPPLEGLGRRAVVVPCDVTDEAAVQQMVARAQAVFGRIDILINAAGVTGPIETPVQDIKLEDFRAVLESNVVGTFLPIKHVLPGMIARRYGKIVNISGTSGLRGYKYRTAYSSSKWALRGLTRTVALEAGPHNVNVNALHPGIVAGDRMDKLCREKAKKRGWTPQRVYQEYVDEMALRRVTVSRDIANAALFLASDESSNMTGQSMTVDGGWDVTLSTGEALPAELLRRPAAPRIRPTSPATSNPPTAARTPTGSVGSGRLMASARSMTRTLLAIAASSIPVPRPVT